MSEGHQNKQFYNDCTSYFEYLRGHGKNDDAFEDEFFYTMPAISNQS